MKDAYDKGKKASGIELKGKILKDDINSYKL